MRVLPPEENVLSRLPGSQDDRPALTAGNHCLTTRRCDSLPWQIGTPVSHPKIPFSLRFTPFDSTLLAFPRLIERCADLNRNTEQPYTTSGKHGKKSVCSRKD